MQYEIDGGNITVVIGEEARIDVPTALSYIKSGQDEIETVVNAGIDAFDLNAANKTTDFNDNYTVKKTAIDNSVERAQIWAEGNDAQVEGLGGTHSAKGWAEQQANNYQVTAIGTTAGRTLQDRFADVVNVKDFGAVGDGTTDDTAAINRAYDAANTKSAKVFFPAGTYLTTGKITRFLNVMAVGDGKIQRGSNVFDIGENQETNNLYVSVDGTGDGLSVDYPTTKNKMASYLREKAFVTNKLILNFAAGTYTSGNAFADVTVSKIDGLVFRGVEPDRVNNIWTTIMEYPSDGSTGAILMIANISNARVENMEFIGPGTSSGTTYGDYEGIYFARDVNRGRVVNCKFDNFPYGIGLSVQECVTVQVYNSIFNNCHSGFYVYNSVGSSLISDGTRNKFTNCRHALYITGASYMHNDHNDFEDCTDCAYVDKGAYCGWNDCTETNCDTIFRLEGGSTCNMDNTSLASSTTDRLFTFGNTRGTNYELYKQGVYLPNVGVNGAWNYGFNNLVLTEQPVVYNVSSNGADCNNRSSVENKNVLVQSNSSRAGFATLTDQSTSGRRGGFYCYDINGTYSYSGWSCYGGFITFWQDGQQNYAMLSNVFRPLIDGTIKLGSASYKWSQLYASTDTINTSDERLKQDIEDIDEAVFRAWEKVNFIQYKFKDAVEKKGENARIHFGVIAQRVKEAFESEGLDGFKYGLLCYDEWEDEFEENKIIDKPAEYDEDDNLIAPAETHIEKILIRPAGNAYGIRYAEALALECAYQRWKLEQLEQRLA